MARVLQCDALTSEWLRTLRGARKEDLVAPCMDDPEHYEVAAALEECPLMMSPLSAWGGPTPHVQHACSFCERGMVKGDLFTVHVNRTLSTPFVLTCVTCLAEQIK